MSPETISVYDQLGRAFAFPRQQWRAEVLPRLLSEAWDEAEMLRKRIRAALREGCAEDLVRAAERLLAIDDDAAAAACVYAEVARRSGNPEAGKRALLAIRERRPEEASPLVSLAEFAREEARADDERELLLAALEIDRNEPVALERLLELQVDSEREALLRRLADSGGSWLPSAFLARRFLDEGRVPEALVIYEDLLMRMPQEAAAITRVTGDLGMHGRTQELVEWFASRFDAKRDGIYAGLNLVQAMISEEKFSEADELLSELFALHAPQCSEHLTSLEEELATHRRRPEIDTSSLQLALIEGPIWAHGVQDAQSLLPPRVAAGEKILLLNLVDASRTAPPADQQPRVETADSFAGFSRSLPLYLAEALRFGSDADPATLIPGIPGFGPVLPSIGWDLPALREAFRDGEMPSLVLEGALREQDGNRELDFCIYDLRSLKRVDRFVIPVFDALPQLAARIEETLVEHLEKLGHLRRRRHRGIWQRPRAEELDAYLRAQDYLLIQALASNRWIDPQALRREAEIFQSFFTLMEAMPGARVPEAMLLRSLVEGLRYASRVSARFVAPMRELLRESLEDGALQALRSLDAMLSHCE